MEGYMSEEKNESGPLNEDGTRNDLVFDATPVLDDDGNVILSPHVREEQAAAGFVPDIQPKASALPVPPVPEVQGKMQPTGNLTVLTAVQAVADPGTIVADPDAVDEPETEVVADPATTAPGVSSPSVEQVKPEQNA